MISGGQDSSMILWDFRNGQILKKLKYHDGIITSVKFNPEHNLIASGSSDHKVIVYDLGIDKLNMNSISIQMMLSQLISVRMGISWQVPVQIKRSIYIMYLPVSSLHH